VSLAERFFGSDGRAHERLADYIDYMMEVQGDVAAVIAEPVRWTTVDVPPAGFWERVRESCDRHGALLVFDEVPSALGRTGHMFTCEHFGVTPDILVIGKGLGGGVMPMAAIIARRDLDVVPEGALGHYTHEKSPLGSAAALATLDVIEQEGLVDRARTLGRSTLARLRALAFSQPLLGKARGLGMFWGVDVQPWAGRPAAEAADRLLYACLERGLSFKVGGGTVATLCPPLNISSADLDRALVILESAATATAAQLGAGG
jgi:4-aminobutyrate aminotransferase